MDVEKALEQTRRVVDLLNDRRGDRDWQTALDAAFLAAAFDHDHVQPCFNGPDGLTYFGYVIPDVGEITVANPLEQLDYMVHWVTGAVILTPDRQAAWVYSPGDVVSMKLHGTSAFAWGGNWDRGPDLEAYETGGAFRVGHPNEHMLPPLAARSLEFALRHLYGVRPALAGREPAAAVVRAPSSTHPEDPSELSINISLDEIGESPEVLQGFQQCAGRHLPAHIEKRLIWPSRLPDQQAFLPLRKIIEDAGLEPAPAR